MTGWRVVQWDVDLEQSCTDKKAYSTRQLLGGAILFWNVGVILYVMLSGPLYPIDVSRMPRYLHI